MTLGFKKITLAFLITLTLLTFLMTSALAKDSFECTNHNCNACTLNRLWLGKFETYSCFATCKVHRRYYASCKKGICKCTDSLTSRSKHKYMRVDGIHIISDSDIPTGHLLPTLIVAVFIAVHAIFGIY